MGAGVEPGEAATELDDLQHARLKISAVDVGNFQFTARRRGEVGGDVEHVIVVEIKARHRPVRLGRGGLFLDRAGGAGGGVELDHAITLGIVDRISEDGRAIVLRGGLANDFAQPGAVKDVVAEHERDRIAADEFAADDERFGKSVGRCLLGVRQSDPERAAIAQQRFEPRQIARGRNDQYLADPGEHQHPERIIDHRLVIDRQQLLGDGQRRRIEPAAAAPGEDDTLHADCSCVAWLAPVIVIVPLVARVFEHE